MIRRKTMAVQIILAAGAGAISRCDIGLTIGSGMLISTLFTLFILPVMYTLKSRAILLLLLSAAAISSGLSALILPYRYWSYLITFITLLWCLSTVLAY